MIRSELVDCIEAQTPHLHPRDVADAVDAILERIMEALAAGDRIELRDFGSFAVVHGGRRQGRNPRTGAAVDVPAKAALQFRPRKAL